MSKFFTWAFRIAKKIRTAVTATVTNTGMQTIPTPVCCPSAAEISNNHHSNDAPRPCASLSFSAGRQLIVHGPRFTDHHRRTAINDTIPIKHTGNNANHPGHSSQDFVRLANDQLFSLPVKQTNMKTSACFSTQQTPTAMATDSRFEKQGSVPGSFPKEKAGDVSLSTKNSFMKTLMRKPVVATLVMVLVSLFAANIANGQIATLSDWSNLYHGTSISTQNISYPVPSAIVNKRVLVVAIASSRTTSGTRNVSISYGGQALTLADGDMGSSLIQHTAIYYLNEAGINAASNSTLSFSVSNGTTYITDVFAAVFENVDQSSPITDAENYNSSSTQTTFQYSPSLTINANNLAIEVVSSHRTGSTTLRTVSSYPSNWSLSTQQTQTGNDNAVRNMMLTRTIPASNTTDNASITMSGSSLPSMTAISLNASNTQPRVYFSTGSFTVPTGVTCIQVEAWGGGGSGGQRTSDGVTGGGGGGAYARSIITVIPGNTYTVTVGSGALGSSSSAGGDSWFGTATTVMAKGGNSVSSNNTSGASGGSGLASIGNIITYNGGNGANGSGTTAGGGGSSAGTGSDGNNGTNQNGGSAPSGGGNGGNGSTVNDVAGSNGFLPGGGGGGSRRDNGTINGGNGADGLIIISWGSLPSSSAAIPVITSIPLCAGSTTVSGSSSDADGTIINVFADGNSIGSTTVSGGAWSATVSALVGGQQVTATAQKSGECSTAPSDAVIVGAPPAAAGPISGTSAACAGTTSLIYSVDPVSGATNYIWTVPTGWTITNGQGTNSITVTAGAAGQGGSITVKTENACGISQGNQPQSISINPEIGTNNTGFTSTSSKTSGDIQVNSGSLRGYLKFPLSALPADATITSSILTLTHNGTNSTSTATNTVTALGNNDPVTTAANTLYSAIGSGTTYSSSIWPLSGSFDLSLNSTANSNIQSRISSPGYIAMGLVRGGTDNFFFHGFAGGANAPTLTVNFNSLLDQTSSLNVSVNPLPTVANSTIEICQGGSSSAFTVTSSCTVPGTQESFTFDNTNNNGTPNNTQINIPAGATNIRVQVWGAGGGAGGNTATNSGSLHGGGGGAYSETTFPTLTSGNYQITVGGGGVGNGTQNASGGSGGSSSFGSGLNLVLADGGNGATTGGGGTGGQAASSTGDITNNGGNGGNRVAAGTAGGGGGGGSAGNQLPVGGNGGNGSGSTGGSAGTAGGGTVGATGAAGGTGANNGIAGNNGNTPGGGAGGRGGSNSGAAGNGAPGRVVVSYTLPATGEITWYNVPSGGTSLHTGETFDPLPHLPGGNTNSPGTYSFYAECSQYPGCRTKVDFVIHPKGAAPVVSSPVTYCLGETAVALTATGDNLLWYTEAVGGTGSATAPVPSTANAGSTTYYVSQTPDGGCESERAAIVVTVHPLPVVDAGSYGPVCVDAADIALAGSPAGGSWSGTGVSGNVNDGFFFDPSVGTQTLTYTYTDGNGCINSDETTITVNALPVMTCPENFAVCIDNGLVVLSGGLPAGGSYSGDHVSGGNFDPAAAGAGQHTITYTYTDVNGCTNSCSFTITVNALPIVTCPADFAVCVSADPFALNSAGPIGGSYSGDGVTNNEFDAGAAGVGDHVITYTYTDPNTGCVNTCTFTITVNALPVMTCPEDFAVCVDAGPVALSGGLPAGGSYSGTGVSGGNFDPAAAGVGPHTITYTYTDENNCTNSCTFTITVNALPVVSAGSYGPVCPEAADIALGGSPAGGTWSGTGVTGNFFDPSAGTQTLTYTYTDGNGCTNSAQTTITVFASPNIEAGSNSPVCVGATIELTASPNGYASYSWTGPNGFGLAPFSQTVTQDFNSIPATAAGTWVDNTTTSLPTISIPGWFAQRSGTGTGIAFSTGTGTGGLYHFGAVGNADRALGTVGSVTPGDLALGYLYHNNSGQTINNATVTYTLEQWRNSAAAAQEMTVWYQTSASPISSLTPGVNAGWTQVTGLTLSSPVTGGVAANLDGNLAANRVSATNIAIPGLSIPDGHYFMIKWEDPDHAGLDHNLAIDDVSITFSGGGIQNPTIPNATTAMGGTYTVTVTDANGCSNSANTEVVVNELPVCSITAVTEGSDGTVCPSSTGHQYSAPAGMSTYLWEVTGNGAISGANDGSSVQVNAGATCGASYTVKLTITDASGCSSTCEIVVNVNDTEGPEFENPAVGPIDLGCNPAQLPTEAIAIAAAGTATDNCNNVLTYSAAGGSIDGECVKTQVWTVTATDACGNEGTATVTYTWTADTQEPEFTNCPVAPISLGCNPETLPDVAAAIAAAGNATDACGTPTMSGQMILDQTTGCVRTMTFMVTATDGCNNASNCFVSYTWTIDTDAPEIIASGSTLSLGCNPTAQQIEDALGSAIANDNCGVGTPTFVDSDVTEDGCSRSQTRTWNVTDNCGNPAQEVSRTVTWTVDEANPEFTACPAAPIDLGCNPSALPDALAAIAAAGAVTDDCGVFGVTATAGAVVENGCQRIQNWTVTATDNCNKTATCTVTYTWIEDLTPPALVNEENIPTGTANINACYADALTAVPAFEANTLAAFYTDACGAVTVEQVGSPVLDGDNCAWTVTYNYKVKDACNNELAELSIIHSGGDKTAPVLKTEAIVPAGGTGIDACTAPAGPTEEEIAALFEDNCEGAITVTKTAINEVVNACGWTVTYNYKVEDACGNAIAEDIQITYSGSDQSAPVGEEPNPVTDVDACKPSQQDAEEAFDAVYAAAGYTDCSGVTASLVSAVVVGDNCDWTVTYTFNVTDGCTNVLTNQTYTRSGGDNSAPTGTMPTAITGIDACQPTQEAAEAAFDANYAAAGYSDCSGVTATLVSAVVDGDNCDWTVTYTFNVTDGCTNVLTNQTYTRSGGDNSAPTGTMPTAITGIDACQPTQEAAEAAFDANYAAAGYSDCSGVTATLVSAVVDGDNCDWTVTYTFNVTDGCSNVLGSQTYTRSGSDQTAPSGTVPAAITGIDACKPSQNDAEEAFDAVYAAAGYTDCSGVTAVLTNTLVDGHDCDWTITYTFKVVNGCGLELTSQTYTRSGGDNTAPVAPAAPGNANYQYITEVPVAGELTANDVCSGEITVTGADTDNGGSACNGDPLIITRTWTFTDACGNTSTAVQTITVENPAVGVVNVSGGGEFCGSAVITATGGENGTIYFQGTTSGGTSTANPSTQETVTVSGTYYFRARSAEGCWGPEGSVTVIVNTIPNVTVSSNSPICQGETLQLTGGPAGMSYSWTGPGGFSVPASKIVTQNFDGLGTGTTWTNNSTLPGWYLFQGQGNATAPATAVTALVAGTGTGTGGAVYNFSNGINTSDRAIGSLASNAIASAGSTAFYYGVEVTNTTGQTMTSATIAYRGEQYRNGGNATAQSLTVDYSSNATALTNGTWTNASALTFTSPVATVTAAATDGNVSATSLSTTITGLSIAPGASFWVRWSDLNDAGNDHGLAIDDVSITIFNTGNQNLSRPNATPAMSGEYTLTVTSPEGCVSSASTCVTVFPTAPVLTAPASTCNEAFTLPAVAAVPGFTAQYSINGAAFSAAPELPSTAGCYSIKARYVLTNACGELAAGATAPEGCEESNEVNVVIFPAAPVLSAPANTCNEAFTLPAVDAVSGFTVQYSINGGAFSATPEMPTTPGCYLLKARYVLAEACGSIAAGTTAPVACEESNEVSVVIFPAAPPAPEVNAGFSAIVVTAPASVPGFTIEYSFDDGQTWGANVPPTADNCEGYKIKTRYVTAADCGNIAAGTASELAGCDESPATIRIVDNTDPVINNCPASFTVNTVAGRTTCDAVVTWTAPTANDNCGQVTLTSNYSPGAVLPVGQTVITYTATDAAGNSTSCSFTVTVVDKTPPVLTCGGTIVVAAPENECFATVTVPAPALFDNCGVAVNSLTNSITGTEPLVASFPIGSTMITWAVADIYGNIAFCFQTVTVTGNVPVVIECPETEEVFTTPGLCSATLPPTFWLENEPQLSAGCGEINFSVQRQDGEELGDPFPTGDNIVIWTAIRNNQVVATCQQIIRVIDNEDPVITTCPVDRDVNLDETCSFVVPDLVSEATATDNCTVTITQFPTAGTVLSSSHNQTHVVTITATDAAGNTDECEVTLTGKDVTDPVITTCPVDRDVNLDETCSFVVPDLVSEATATDNCTVTITQFPTAGTVLSSSHNQTHVVTITATDAAGNTDECEVTLTGKDVTDPVITCVGNQTKTTDLDACSYTVVGTEFDPVSFADNCTATISNDFNNSNTLAGAVFPTGTTTVTWTVTDGGGNTATCSFDVTVDDEQLPNAICQNITVELDVNGNVTITPEQVDNGSNDACGIASLSLDITQFTCANVGPNTVTLTVTDVNGNVSTCTATVTVEDKIGPAFSNVPVIAPVNAGTGTCQQLVSWTVPTVTDACGVASLTVSVVPFTPVITIGTTALAQFSTGNNIVTYTATDVNGNETTASFTVTVVDNQPPILTGCPGNITTKSDAGQCGAIIGYVQPTASDNCPGVTLTINNPAYAPGSFFPVGVHTVIYTATDAYGNSVTCTFTVTVEDKQAPVPNVIILPDVTGVCAATVTAPTATDNCDGLIIGTTSDPTTYNTPGNYVITWTYTDGSGNSSIQTQNVIVEADPAIITADPQSLEVCEGDEAVFSVTATGATGYQWQINTGEGWNDIDGETGTTLTIDPTTLAMDGNQYRVLVYGNCGDPAVSEAATLTVNELTESTLTETRCDSYTWPVELGGTGQAYTVSGTYTNQVECHIYTLNLTIVPSQSFEETITSCDSYVWPVNNQTYNNSGTYTHTIGCDTYKLILTINESTSSSETVSACDSYTWTAGDGATYTQSGTYTHVATNAAGCPHTMTLNLTITESTSSSETVSVCDSYTWEEADGGDGETYTESGTYTNVVGCHTYTLNLTITTSSSSTVTVTACDEYEWALNGATYAESGEYSYTENCHTTTLILTIIQSEMTEQTQSACDSYLWPVNNQTYTESGTYTHTVGCHTYELLLTITPSTNSSVTQTACDSYFWPLSGETYTQSGNYPFVTGCNTTTLNLTIIPSSSSSVTVTACDEYEWALNGQTYAASGEYSYTANCHTTTLILTIIQSETTEQTQSACDSYLWPVNNQTYTESGTYTHTVGCHTYELLLTITPSTNSSVTQTACDSYFWPLSGETYTQSGNYPFVTGCNTTTLNLTIIPSSSSSVTVTACDEYEWALNGQTYAASGEYSYTANCHTTTLILTIIQSETTEQTQSACDSYLWPVNNQTYTESGTYTHTVGCHTYELLLTITPSTNSSVTQTACDSYFWPLSGETYTQSGNYPFVTGCNTTTLNLTIIPSSSSSVTVTACDEYAWELSGETYTESGEYTHVDGCHTTTLILTIIESSTVTSTESACGEYLWPVNGETYTASGTYNFVDGCVTYVLNLTITQPASASISYAGGPYCGNNWVGVNRTGQAGGTYSAGAGLYLDPNTGWFNPGLSTPGTYTITYTYGTAPCIGTATASVTIIANNPPVITCPQNITVNALPFVCFGIVLDLGDPTVSGGCGGIASISNDAASIFFPVGTTTITWTVTDNGGNVVTCTQTVTVVDTQDPFFICPGDRTVNANAGQCYATNVNLGSPSFVFDNCGVASVTNNAPAQFPVGTTVVTWTVTDVNGNTSTCTQDVTVVDNQNPSITCPANISTGTNGGLCSASVTVPDPVTNDNCGVTRLTWSMSGATSGSSPATGIHVVGTRTFNVGTTTITYTVRDAANRTATCSFTVTVTDDDAPVPAVETLPVATGVCNVTVTAPTAIDNCNGVITGTTTDPLTYTVPGEYTITWTYTDASGNSSTQTQSVVVTSQEIEITIEPLSLTVCEGESASFTVTAPGATAFQWQVNEGRGWSDIPGEDGSTLTINPATNDMSGNQYRVLVTGDCTDSESEPATLIVNPLPEATITYPGGPVFCGTDWAGPIITGQAGGSFSASPGGLYLDPNTGWFGPNLSQPGTYTITYTFSDGNCSNTATTEVTIVASGTPIITCPAVSPFSRVVNSEDCKYAVQGTEFDATATANCGQTTLSYSLSGATTGSGGSSLAGVLLNAGQTIITWTATNGSNSVQCSITVNVNAASQALSIVSGPDNESACAGQSATFSVQTNISATYQWQVNTGSGWNNIPGAENSSLIINPVTPGLNGNQYRVIVAASCNENETVTSDPAVLTVVASPTASISYPGGPQYCGTSWVGPTITGQTGGSYSASPAGLYMDPNTGWFAPNLSTPGTYTITYTYSNGTCSNTTTATVTIVTSGGSPVIFCPSNITTNAIGNSCSRMVNVPNVTYQSGCSPVTRLTWVLTGATTGSSPSTGIRQLGNRSFNVGVTTATFTATNAAGNSSTCSFTITVVDNINPVINCPSNITLNTQGNNCSRSVNVPNPSSSDNCGIVARTWVMTGATTGSSASSGINSVGTRTFNVGVTTITYTVRDASGNTASCSFNVTIRDQRDPDINCPSNRVYCRTANDQYILPVLTASDNCGIASITYQITGATNRSGTGVNASGLLNPGTSVIRWTVTDVNGNTSTCTTNITIRTFNCTPNVNPSRDTDDPVTPGNGTIVTNPKGMAEIIPADLLEITAFPNPTTSFFNLRVKSDSRETVEIRVFDMVGKLVQQQRGAAEQVYRLGDHLVSGMYIVEVRQGAKKATTKVVKQ